MAKLLGLAMLVYKKKLNQHIILIHLFVAKKGPGLLTA